MSNFNFSNPTPTKTNEKKGPWWEKIWAGLSLISLFGDSMIPKDVRNSIPIAVRNIAILILIIIIIYLVVCGVIINAQWIIEYSKGFSLSLGDSFYHFAFVIILFLIIDCFFMDNRVSEIATKKKQTFSFIKESRKAPSLESIKSLKKEKFFSIASPISNIATILWWIIGILFYDRMLFISLVGLSFVFSIITTVIKDHKLIKIAFLMEVFLNIIFILFILINHFYLNIL